jgi:RNA ligase (TIGR02306 family)
MERKLASVQRILDIQPIEGADKIVRAQINGWWVVTAIENGFNINDLVCYFEIDSWVPTEIASFLSKGKEPREFEGVKGERLRTIRLRKQLSQGLIIPIPQSVIDGAGSQVEEGLDLTEHLGVKKWEKPMNAQLQGVCRGNFPSFIRKTDQERCQNIPREIREAYESGEEFEVSVKIDGSSMTVYGTKPFSFSSGVEDVVADREFGVCSRNLDLKMEGNDENAFVKKAVTSGLLDKLKLISNDVAIQGELYGEGIQGNNEKIVGHKFAVFDIFDIETQTYMTPELRREFIRELKVGGVDIDHIEILHTNFKLTSPNISDLLLMAEGKNAAGNEREGLVFKSTSRNFSFKAISNKFLEGEE